MAQQRTLPSSRNRETLLVERLKDELMVFDMSTQKAHCLSPAAALVWEHCDGSTSVAGMATLLADAGLGGGVALVDQAVSELALAGLVEARSDRRGPAHRMSRRRALKKIGVVAGGVAGAMLVHSLVAPPAAFACSPVGAPCQSGPQCCTGHCAGVCTPF